MSVEQAIAIALRKERLLIQVAEQRETLAEWGARLRKPCTVADKTMEAGRYLKAHPLATGAAVGVAAVLGRRRLFGAAKMAWRGWRAWRMVQGLHQEYIKKYFKNK